MKKSYSNSEIESWLKLSPEQRVLEAEELWEEFLIKHPQLYEPFWKSFSSFEEYQDWLYQQGNPVLW